MTSNEILHLLGKLHCFTDSNALVAGVQCTLLKKAQNYLFMLFHRFDTMEQIFQIPWAAVNI